ncbi:AmmeMemoRadiSam system protein B [Thioalkalivibrio denitrificans]|uniref:MEMO1 family protein B1C78_03000 n=1 Tax=Thioalkalivibrio denitrificans TaxID=108003 RepID=A0A1V3NR92_9GAMM|nr:AmmeMemoRadiSam system protein B [Thioalkalivibrio denitrificans]OOG27635.1 AmmeMemoRadiSam system protein B [Thioalkalivibrio denitrificans]
MSNVREPAVAGLFYPDNPEELRGLLAGYLRDVAPDGPPPKALIVPHAGYPYSGPVAASAYTRLMSMRETVRRVVLLGPSHRVPLTGLATSSAGHFRTPLGDVPVDRAAVVEIEQLPQVRCLDEAHRQEHSLEVHLPFLQTLLADFTLVPLVAGNAPAAQVAEVLERLWGGAETLIVISSDLSHFHDYDTARLMDGRTSRAIEQLQWETIDFEDACGRVPISGLLEVARRRGMHVTRVDLRNSGDTAGPRNSVVGYGAYLVH